MLQVKMEKYRFDAKKLGHTKNPSNLPKVTEFKKYRGMIGVVSFVVILEIIVFVLNPILGFGSVVLYLLNGWVAYLFLSILLPLIVILGNENLKQFVSTFIKSGNDLFQQKLKRRP